MFHIDAYTHWKHGMVVYRLSHRRGYWDTDELCCNCGGTIDDSWDMPCVRCERVFHQACINTAASVAYGVCRDCEGSD